MRHAFAHDAVLDMDPDADIRAPGAAVTVELCGHWDHEPPCPLAPHHTAVERTGRDVRLRILFATSRSTRRRPGWASSARWRPAAWWVPTA